MEFRVNYVILDILKPLYRVKLKQFPVLGARCMIKKKYIEAAQNKEGGSLFVSRGDA